MRKVMRWVLVVAALAVVAAGCSSDDKDDAGKATTTTAADDTTTTGGDGVDPGTADAPMADTEYCKTAAELNEKEDVLSADDIQSVMDLAPDEIADAVGVAGPPLKAADGDVVKFFNAYAEDEVEEAVEELNAFEEEQCGIPHSEERSPLPDGASREVEDDAKRLDVVAKDYSFDIPDELGPGRTSFVLTNQGQEAHFLMIGKLADGVTLEEVMQSDDGEGIEMVWDTNLAAAGGEDEEVVTFDLAPGNYGAMCFLPGPDGTPHAMSGMAMPFTVK